MQHGLAPPGPNTDARVDAIVEAIKSTNVQNLGRKIDRLRLDGGEEWNKLQRKIAHQADNADQTNRQKFRTAVNRLFTHNPLTDPEVRHVLMHAFGLSVDTPVLGTGKHPLEKDTRGELIQNFVLAPDNTKQISTVGTHAEAKNFLLFLRK